MHWRLFDIRSGRINRQQLLGFVLLSLVFFFAALSIKINSISIPVACLALYFILVGTVKRLRDIGLNYIPMLSFYFLYAFFILFIPKFFLFAFIPMVLLPHVQDILLFCFWLYTAFIVFQLLKPGNKGFNDYGPSPENLDYASLSSEKLKEMENEYFEHKERREEDRIKKRTEHLENQNELTETPEHVEFKGR